MKRLLLATAAALVAFPAVAQTVGPTPVPAGVYSTNGALKSDGTGNVSQANCASLSDAGAGCSGGTAPALPVSTVNGGTGASLTPAVGDLLSATSPTVFGRVADVATGQVFKSGGVGVAPAWGTIASSFLSDAANLPLLNTPNQFTAPQSTLIAGTSTTLGAAITTTGFTGSQLVGSTTGWPSSCSTNATPNGATCYGLVDAESYSFYVVDGTHINILARGLWGTTAATHLISASIQFATDFNLSATSAVPRRVTWSGGELGVVSAGSVGNFLTVGSAFHVDSAGGVAGTNIITSSYVSSTRTNAPSVLLNGNSLFGALSQVGSGADKWGLGYTSSLNTVQTNALTWDGTGAVQVPATMALGGATIGSNALAVTGNVAVTGTITANSGNVSAAFSLIGGQVFPGTASNATITSPSPSVIRLGNNAATNTVDLTVGASGLLTLSGGLTLGNTVNFKGYTVSTLPASPATGAMAYVSDAVACTFLASVTGGGSAFCPVIYTGSAWQGG